MLTDCMQNHKELAVYRKNIVFGPLQATSRDKIRAFNSNLAKHKQT